MILHMNERRDFWLDVLKKSVTLEGAEGDSLPIVFVGG